MDKQMSFTDYEYSLRKRKTKREEFLGCMDEITPWDEVVAMIEPYYYHNKEGRKARDIETMFRMYLLQTWYNLSDEALEDTIYGVLMLTPDTDIGQMLNETPSLWENRYVILCLGGLQASESLFNILDTLGGCIILSPLAYIN